MAKVSVIIPAYNVKKYLSRCLDSVVSQTYKDLEIICINDGSTDKTQDVIEKYAQFDNRIIAISTGHEGVAHARNLGIKIANGKYIIFVDSDDYIASIMVEELVNYIEKTKAEVVISDHASSNFRRDLFKSAYIHYKQLDCVDTADIIPIDKDNLSNYLNLVATCWNKIFSSEFLKSKSIKFPSGIMYEDVIFWAKVFLNAQKMCYVPKAYYFYRRNRTGSLMSLSDEHAFDIITVHNMLQELFIKYNMYDKIKNILDYIKIRDFIIKILTLEEPYKERFFNMVKTLNIEVNYEELENLELDENAKKYIQYFRLFQDNDYENFCNLTKDINTYGY